MSLFSSILPTEITDDPLSKPVQNETKSTDYNGILEKLKELSSKETELKKSNNSKSYRSLKNRVSFVLNHTSEEDKKDSLKDLKQVIELDISDSYVSFGVQDRQTGLTASAKSSALILTDEVRKKLEEGAPGDKVHEIKPKLGKKALKKKKELERNKTKGKLVTCSSDLKPNPQSTNPEIFSRIFLFVLICSNQSFCFRINIKC